MALCTAHTLSRGGASCRNHAIPGGTVCRYHGGSAPQVKKKALERLAALVDPAITELSDLLHTKSAQVRLGAVKDVLDRTGHKPTDRVEQTNYTQEDVERLSVLSPEELEQYIELRRKMAAAKEPDISPV